MSGPAHFDLGPICRFYLRQIVTSVGFTAQQEKHGLLHSRDIWLPTAATFGFLTSPSTPLAAVLELKILTFSSNKILAFILPSLSAAFFLF